MKKVLIAFALLLALAVFVAPALAKPPASTASHSLKWRGAGVASDNPLTVAHEIIGVKATFDGAATVNSIGSWTGGGAFVIPGRTMDALKANLAITGGDYNATHPNLWKMYGWSTVTTMGQTYTDVFFELTIDTSVPSYHLVIETPDMETGIPWLYWVSPFKGMVRSN